MKKGLLFTVLFWILMVVFVSQSGAAQFGFTVGASAGSGESGDGYDYDETSKEFDLTMNLGKSSRLVIYRLNVGYVSGEIDYGTTTYFDYYYGRLVSSNLKEDYVGIVVNNTVGFKIIKKPNFRLWAGGSLYLGRIELDGNNVRDLGGTVVGAGPTLGLDFDLRGGPTLSLEVGARYLNTEFDNDDDFIVDSEAWDVALRLSLLWGK